MLFPLPHTQLLLGGPSRRFCEETPPRSWQEQRVNVGRPVRNQPGSPSRCFDPKQKVIAHVMLKQSSHFRSACSDPTNSSCALHQAFDNEAMALMLANASSDAAALVATQFPITEAPPVSVSCYNQAAALAPVIKMRDRSKQQSCTQHIFGAEDCIFSCCLHCPSSFFLF